MPEGRRPVLRYNALEDVADVLLVATYSGVSDNIDKEERKVMCPFSSS